MELLQSLKVLIDNIIATPTSVYLISEKEAPNTSQEIMGLSKDIETPDIVKKYGTKLLFLFSRFARWVNFHHYEQTQRKAIISSEEEDSASDRDRSRADSDLDSSLESSSDVDSSHRGKKRKPITVLNFHSISSASSQSSASPAQQTRRSTNKNDNNKSLSPMQETNPRRSPLLEDVPNTPSPRRQLAESQLIKKE